MSTPTAQKVTGTEIAHIRRDPLGHLLVADNLRHAGFEGVIADDESTRAKYSTDESIFSITPQLVLIPKSEEDVVIATRVIANATKEFPNLSLTPRAAGTGLSGGSLTDSIVIDIQKHLTAIEAPKKNGEKLTITCEPGAYWRDVDAVLSEIGYYLPSYPASKDICSIGGAVANNAAGPDSLRYGHTADWVESLRVVLCDGSVHDVTPLSYRELKTLMRKNHALGRIAKTVYDSIKKNERAITRAKPKTEKNTAGYALWDVLETSVKEFERGVGTFDLTRLFAGSQGTIGIITSITLRGELIKKNTTLVTIPVFNLQDVGTAVIKVLEYNPINIELFDDRSFDLALKNPWFFREHLSGLNYYKAMFAMYTTFHVRYAGQLPAFTILITLTEADHDNHRSKKLVEQLRHTVTPAARIVKDLNEVEIFWQIRRASYLLSKLEDPTKRPAAFLEDMTVPPKHIPLFLRDIKRLLREYNVGAAMHGHGGNGHFHFYPLLDFTDKTTPKLIERMSNDFFELALMYGGSICGEHNDGIIRTPYLQGMFTKNILKLFADIEHTFDPDDIFNPGKKVNPRYDIHSSVRTKN